MKSSELMFHKNLEGMKEKSVPEYRSGLYVDIEDVVDPETEISRESLVDEIIEEDFERRNNYTDKEIKIKELENEIRNTKTIGSIHTEHTAHIGPEFANLSNDENDDSHTGKELKKIDENDADSHPSFLSKSQILRNIISGFSNYRKDHRNTGSEHDNFKTMPDSKRERMSRKETRDFLDNSNN